MKLWFAFSFAFSFAFFLVTPVHGQLKLIAGRYEVLGDGSEIKDKQTGLIWQRCSVGQYWENGTCAGEAKEFHFEEAQALSKGDWQVPTIRELASLIKCSSEKMKYEHDPEDGGRAIKNGCDGDYQKPTIDTVAFPNTPSNIYWSSSPFVDDLGYVWSVAFSYGSFYSNYRNYGSYNHVRLVRMDQ